MTIRKLVAVGSAAVLSIPTYIMAEGASMTVDTTAAGNAVDAIGSALSDLITGKVTTNVLLILGAGLVIAAIFLGVRWMMRGGKVAAKG